MSDEEIKKKSTNIVLYLVFFATLAVVIPSILSVFFPALILFQTTPFHEESVDPFEIGGMAAPFLTTSVVLLGFGLLYYSGNLPYSIQRPIKFILNFEVSRKISFIVILILLTIYVVLSVEELTEPEIWPDIETLKRNLNDWPFKDKTGDFSLNYPHVKFFLLTISEEIFQNFKIIPFIASISLLILTYFFTVEISKKRFSGLISIAILLQSFIFLTFDSSATYTNFWTLFYLLSLYLIIKKWQLSTLSYVFSILSKPITMLFLPSTLFFIYRSKIPKKQKIHVGLSYALLVGIGMVAIFLLDVNPGNFLEKDYTKFDKFLNGFAALAFQLRYDQFFIVFLIPLICGLFMISRKGNKLADAILFLILLTLLSAPITNLAGLSIEAYRFIPFTVFFSIGIGIFDLYIKNNVDGRNNIVIGFESMENT